MKKSKQTDFLILSVLVLFSLFLVFHNLGASTIHDWDEARHAQNALEILRANDWIVMRYGGQPDMWNLKPPLGAWLIALSFRVLGVNEFALRFWSALAAVGTVVIVYLFGLRMKNWLTGLVAALILLVNKGFIGIHGARTGDYDILLTFFISLSLYLFYLYLQNRKAIYLISIAFSTGAAVLIKSAVGLLPLAVILLYLLFTKSIRQHLNKDSLYALLVFVFVTAPWFVLRFLRGSDFIVKMITVDILARSTTNKGCSLSSMQYLYYLITLNSHFGIALLILVAAGFMYLIYLIRKNKAFVLFAIWIALPIVAFAVAQCKHRWYLLPIYPALCLAASIMLDDLRAWFRARELLFLLCFVVLLTPLISSAVEPDEIFDDRTGESVKQLQKNLENVNLLYINETDNTQSIFFYLSLYCNCEVRTYKNIDEINETAEYSIITFEHRHGHKMEVRII